MARVSRRTILKGGVAGLSTVVLGPDLLWKCLGSEGGRERLDVSLYTGRATRGIPTTCGLCEAGCGMLAFVDEGRLIGLAGNPAHPYNRGALCAFGSAAARLNDGPNRIRKPLRRLGPRGESSWAEISWQEALRYVTAVLKALPESGEDRARGLAVCVSGKEATPMLTRFLAFCRNGLLAVADDHEHPVEAAACRSFGPAFGGSPGLADADRILNFGANPLGSIRRLVGTARAWAEGRDRGVKWVTLDPRLSETAAASHAWIPLRPGTDGAFALAAAHQILKNGWANRSFLEGDTDVDLDALGELLSPWRPEKVARMCQVPPDRIRWAAEEFAMAQRPAAILGSGVTGRRGGLEDAQSILLLNLMVGRVGREVGFADTGRMEWGQPDPWPPANRSVPVLRGTLFWDLKKGNRRIGCLLTHDADPAVTDPDPAETARTLKDEQRVPFHVALASHWNETVGLADLVLPASTFLESWRLHEPFGAAGPSACVSLRQPVCSPEGDARSLDEFLLMIAAGLGGDWNRTFPFRDVEGYYRLLVGRTLSAAERSSGFRELTQTGFLTLPECARGRTDRHCVKSVVARIVPRIAKNASEAESHRQDGMESPLILFAAPTRGSLLYPCDWVDEIDHADPVMMHPKTAERLQIREGDRVLLKGPAGSVETRVRLTEGIHPEALAMPAACLDREASRGGHGPPGSKGAPGRWWRAGSYGGNGRKVVPWPENPAERAPGWMDTAVTVTRLGKL
jgi:anaerobic selenocysteine-containing dehydrogenase